MSSGPNEVRFALRTPGRNPGFPAVARESAKFCSAGAGSGLAGAFGVPRFLVSQLDGARVARPLTRPGIAVAMAIAGRPACRLPARRAIRVDPLRAAF
ncbi:MAG TPA: hypothetical protein VKB24_06145 [Candidatus Acidoferrum sp.]|nr:hypothetical protein [Candidatus Acidoferrum sp.]